MAVDYDTVIEIMADPETKSRDIDVQVAMALGRSVVRCPRWSISIDETVALLKHGLPGWGWRVAQCSVSDDAWVFPDFNCPVHGERLRREFDESIDWTDLTDVDLRPAGRPAVALLISMMKALTEINHDDDHKTYV